MDNLIKKWLRSKKKAEIAVKHEETRGFLAKEYAKFPDKVRPSRMEDFKPDNIVWYCNSSIDSNFFDIYWLMILDIRDNGTFYDSCGCKYHYDIYIDKFFVEDK